MGWRGGSRGGRQRGDGVRSGMPLVRTARAGGGAAPARRPTVRGTVLSRVSPTVAEASVVVHDGTRVRAAAVRMELHRGTWRATVLQIG